MNIFIEQDNNSHSIDYKKFYLFIVSDDGIDKSLHINRQKCGHIFLEKKNNTWHVDLMKVYPTGKGLGTLFLQKLLQSENLNPKKMTVSPMSAKSLNFFEKNGFVHFK